MSFTKEDVLEALENNAEYMPWRSTEWEPVDFINDGDGWYEIDGIRLTLDGEKHVIEMVEEIGGGEGSGEYTAVIFKIGDRLFRQEGYYASHYGTDWDGDFDEVEAYEKTVTAYRPV